MAERHGTAGRTAVFLSVICVLAGLVSLLASWVAAGHDPEAGRIELISHMLRDLGIICASIGLISFLYEWLIRKQLIDDVRGLLSELVDPDARRLGVKALFRSRADRVERLAGIDQIIASARTDLFCLGLGLIQFIPERQQIILRQLRDGCRFRFLVFNPTSDCSAQLDASLGYGDGNLLRFIETQIKFITAFQEELRREGLETRFEVRTYAVVPTFGMIEVDRNRPSHRIIVEINGYRAEGADCPGFELTPTSEGWSGFFCERAQIMWEAAKPI